MPRRLLSLLSVGVVVLVGAAGCAEDVAPAASVGDTTVSDDELMDEVDAWASSPTLLKELQIIVDDTAEIEGGSGPGSYKMDFVDLVLTNRVAFELHELEFEERDMELTDEDREGVRSQLFASPSVTTAVFDELGETYADQLVDDVARQFKLQTELGQAEYAAWAQEAFTRTDIEVSPRYGSWDRTNGSVVAPFGPTPAPSDTGT